MLRYLTSGESHGPALTAIVEGFPSGVTLDTALIDRELERRQGGYGRGKRQKLETDRVIWYRRREEIETEKFVLKPDRPHYSRDDFLKSIPLGRFPRAADLAWAAVFLASDESSFLTGIDIPIDGGLMRG